MAADLAPLADEVWDDGASPWETVDLVVQNDISLQGADGSDRFTWGLGSSGLLTKFSEAIIRLLPSGFQAASSSVGESGTGGVGGQLTPVSMIAPQPSDPVHVPNSPAEMIDAEEVRETVSSADALQPPTGKQEAPFFSLCHDGLRQVAKLFDPAEAHNREEASGMERILQGDERHEGDIRGNPSCNADDVSQKPETESARQDGVEILSRIIRVDSVPIQPTSTSEIQKEEPATDHSETQFADDVEPIEKQDEIAHVFQRTFDWLGENPSLATLLTVVSTGVVLEVMRSRKQREAERDRWEALFGSEASASGQGDQRLPVNALEKHQP